MNMWPQFLMAILIVTVTITSAVRHGKPMKNPAVNGYTNFWVSMWLALVLGAGGFWNAR